MRLIERRNRGPDKRLLTGLLKGYAPKDTAGMGCKPIHDLPARKRTSRTEIPRDQAFSPVEPFFTVNRRIVWLEICGCDSRPRSIPLPFGGTSPCPP